MRSAVAARRRRSRCFSDSSAAMASREVSAALGRVPALVGHRAVVLAADHHAAVAGLRRRHRWPVGRHHAARPELDEIPGHDALHFDLEGLQDGNYTVLLTTQDRVKAQQLQIIR